MSGDNEQPGEWNELSALVGESADLAQRGAELAGQVRDDWEGLAESEAPWTTDTIMNEVVNSWEHVTPLMGEAIQQGIDLSSWWLRNFWPSAGRDVASLREAADDSAIGETAGAFLDIGQRAVDRIMSETYESADAVDDWATMFGLVGKETWRQSAAAGQGATDKATGPAAEDQSPEPDVGP